MIYYPDPVRAGTNRVGSLGDGYTISISWYQALSTISNYQIAYNIYYSTYKDDVFSDGIKYTIFDGSRHANIIDLTPGQLYFLAVRPVEYDPLIFNLSLLPLAYDNLYYYPTSLLRQDIGPTDLIIPLIDVSGFPTTGVIKAGLELIQYLAVDQVNNNLVLSGGVSPVGAHLVVQTGGNLYLPYPNNIGQGTLNNLTVVGTTAPSENWNIKCIFVQYDDLGNPMPNTAKFEAIGSVSGVQRDIYTNVIIWVANGGNVAGDILSFSITETSVPFRPGDGFTAQVIGVTPGTTGGRGYNNTPITEHTTSGFDGYNTWNPIIPLFTLYESKLWDRIFTCQCRFEYPNFAF